MQRPHHVLQGRDYAHGKNTSLPDAGFSLPKKVAQITLPDTAEPARWDTAAVFSAAFHSLEFYAMSVAKNIWNISLW